MPQGSHNHEEGGHEIREFRSVRGGINMSPFYKEYIISQCIKGSPVEERAARLE